MDIGIEISWVAIILATVASMAIAAVWYQDFAFGTPWKRLTQIDTKHAEEAGNTPMIIVLFVNFMTATILAAFIDISESHFGYSSIWLALLVGLVVWLAFSATTLLTHNIFEQKDFKLTAINNGYQLAMFATMSCIIGVM